MRNIKSCSARYAFYLHANTLSPKSSTRLSNSSRRQQVVTSYSSGLFKVTTAVGEGSAVGQPCELGSTGTRVDGKGVRELGLRGGIITLL